MTRKRTLIVLWLLVGLITIGMWLMGMFGIEIRIGSHVFGRYIGINNEETTSSLLGWLLMLGGTIALIVVLYRNR